MRHTFLQRWLCRVAAGLLLGSAAPAAALPQGFSVVPVLTGLNYPGNLAFAPDGRVFYNELKRGRIRVIRDGLLVQQPFYSLDILNRNEQGLIGLALHPEFPAQPWVYVFYTARKGPAEQPVAENRLARIQANGDVGTAIETLLVFPTNQAPGFHNGGEMRFGPDGKLYLVLGDAFAQNLAPSLDTLAGKILRLDPDGTGAAGNPFSGGSTQERIWTYGHRNSIGLAFHPLTQFLYETENGPAMGDEINRIVGGTDYGWPACKGFCDPPQAGRVDPIRAYTPTIAPTGIDFLSPTLYPAPYSGDLIFASYNPGRQNQQGLLHRLHLDPADPDRVTAVDESFFDLFDLIPQGDTAEHQLAAIDVTAGPDGLLWFTVADFVDDPERPPDAPLAGIYRLVPPTVPGSVPALPAGWAAAALAAAAGLGSARRKLRSGLS